MTHVSMRRGRANSAMQHHTLVLAALSPTAEARGVCAQCEGSGRVTMTLTICSRGGTESDRSVALPCPTCDGAGRVTPAQAEEHHFALESWCECPRERPGTGAPPVYHGDGETPERWCVRKHHYHCAACRKLVQIG